jgi:hypothetical protein
MHPCRLECRIPAAHAPRCEGIAPRFTAFCDTLSQPLAQKLTGQVANGDLARANFAGDYEPTLLRTEEVDGEPMYVLELKAASRGVTYHRVLYWVNASNFHPYKAEFYTISKRLMKVCHYTDFRELGDEIRPTRLLMEDALRAGERSELVYSKMVKRELRRSAFMPTEMPAPVGLKPDLRVEHVRRSAFMPTEHARACRIEIRPTGEHRRPVGRHSCRRKRPRLSD